jgi:6-phosphogluconate dehydrogenase
MQADFGVVGIGVMGAALAQNLERNGSTVALYNDKPAAVTALLAGPGAGRRFVGAADPAAFAAAIAPPRRILILVPAGAAVDAVLAALRAHLEPGDIVIDGGNSHWRDTERRIAAAGDLRFVGMGISGGAEGALHGPSLMPGCDPATYAQLEPVLTRIAARSSSGPCVTRVGDGAAGHFVKMVHNGIEYGDMQLIAEIYDLLRFGAGFTAGAVAELFAAWNRVELQSYLIEITAAILRARDDRGGDALLVDRILDVAEQKGTGRWTSEAALAWGVPVPTLAAAVDARALSARPGLRAQLARSYGAATAASHAGLAEAARSALYAAKIIAYAQGFDLLRRADRECGFGLRPDELARIWTAGCIIRARLLDVLRAAWQAQPDLEHLLGAPDIAALLQARLPALRTTVAAAQDRGIPVPAMASALAYFDSLRRARLPASLVQAQRDYFGAHTYRRIDVDGVFHSDWPAPENQG